SQEVELVEPMDDGHLYLKSPEEKRALKLLPLIKVMPSPRTAENACYFYNRRQRGRGEVPPQAHAHGPASVLPLPHNDHPSSRRHRLVLAPRLHVHRPPLARHPTARGAAGASTLPWSRPEGIRELRRSPGAPARPPREPTRR